MKKLIIIYLLILTHSNSNAQNGNEESKWGEWTSTSEFKSIEFRAKYTADTKSGKKRAQLEFRNVSNRGITFHWYVLDKKRSPDIYNKDNWWSQWLDANKSVSGLTYEVYDDNDFITVYIGGVILSNNSKANITGQPGDRFLDTNQDRVEEMIITDSEDLELCLYCSLFKDKVSYLKNKCKNGTKQTVENYGNHADAIFGEIILEQDLVARDNQKIEQNKVAQSPKGQAIVAGVALVQLASALVKVSKNKREANSKYNPEKETNKIVTSDEKRKKRLKIYYASLGSILAVSIAINHDKIF